MNKIIQKITKAQLKNIHQETSNQCFFSQNFKLSDIESQNIFKYQVQSKYFTNLKKNYLFYYSTNKIDKIEQKKDKNGQSQQNKHQQQKIFNGAFSEYLSFIMRFKNSLLFNSTFIFLIYGGLLSYIIINKSQLQYIFSLKSLNNKKLQQYGKKSQILIPQPYISHPYLQQKIQHAFKYKLRDHINIITSQKGVGKSTIIKYVAKKIRENDNDFYYVDVKELFINLRTSKQRRQSIQQILAGVRNKYNSLFKSDKEQIKLVLNNVESLAMLDQQDIKYLLSDFNTITIGKGINVTCITNSNNFYSKHLMNEKGIRQYSNCQIIPDINGENYINLVKAMVQKYNPSLLPIIKNYMIQENYPIKKIIQRIQTLKAKNIQNQSQQMNYLKNQDMKQFQKIYNSVSERIDKLSNISLKKIFLQQILNSSQQFSYVNCYNIRDNVPGSYNQFSDLTKKLQQDKLTIYCRPRTKLHRKVFKQVLKDKFNQ